MRVERACSDAFALRVSGVDLSALVAALRVAVDVLEASAETAEEATATLRALLADYERGLDRL